MSGQYDGLAIVELPHARTAAAVSLAPAGTDALHEVRDALVNTGRQLIAERAKQISYQPPGA
jgi:hypothetical protein